jgi:4-hydroxy-3-methylbut-2-enyl diphosphate reductase
MKILIAEHYGLCFGVRDALHYAEQLARQTPLTILGELVHNPIVRERLAAAGVREAALDSVGVAPTSQVMITAHGASDAQRKAWRTAGYGVADATCPLVRHAHDQLRTLIEQGWFPVVIGKRGHVEVNGLTGDFPDAFVLETEADLAELPRHSRYGVISQTTQTVATAAGLVAALRSHCPEAEVRFCDTICKPTKDRQAALGRLLGEVELMVVVGGKGSNNTRQLVEASRAAGVPAHHVERVDELRADWFEGVNVVGLTAGTSTLKETVEAVHRRLLTF